MKRKISSGQNGLFVGTPCQCSALHSLLDKEKLSSLIVCDFICHGVASPLIFDKFKSYLKSHYGAPLNIEFRHKENGCGSYFYYKGSIGKYIIPNYARSYPFAYASGLIIADDCTDCKYCSINRYSDITLGDFVSGPTDFSKSTIFVNTNRGDRILRECAGITLQYEDLEDVISKSWHLTTPNTKNPQRRKVFDNIHLTWEELENKFFRPPSKIKLYKNALINKIIGIIRK